MATMGMATAMENTESTAMAGMVNIMATMGSMGMRSKRMNKTNNILKNSGGVELYVPKAQQQLD